MSSSSSSGVADWFVQLPLSDSRCSNASCAAFQAAVDKTEAEISRVSQFNYGHYVTWFYAIILVLFIGAFGFHQCRDRLGWGRSKPSQWRSWIVGWIRRFTYKRFSGKLAESLSLPSFGVLSLIVFFFFAAAVMVFVQRPYYREKIAYGMPPLAIRAGGMAFALIPMEIVLAGKYNLITLLTGVGHEKLNCFHRGIGYLMFCLSIIHATPFIHQLLKDGGYPFLNFMFYKNGSREYSGTPTIFMLLGLSVFSVPPIRRRMYELFVNLHVILAIAFVGLCFWHAAHEMDSWIYLWVTLGLWVVSYIGRIFAKSTAFPMSRQWRSGCPTTMYSVPDNMLRADVHVPKGTWKWEPGQHVYLRFPTLNGLENHPFTIANCCPSSSPDAEKPEGTTLKFLLRPRTGITARLASMTQSSELPGLEGEFSTVVEGPYGTIIRPRVETRYETAILVGGGGGISGVLPWLEHLSLRMSSNCITQKVHFLWIVKHTSSLHWMSHELNEIKSRDPSNKITIQIWITSDSAPSDDEQHITEKSKDHPQAQIGVSEDNGSSSDLAKSSWIDQITYQRPQLSQIIPGLLGSERNIVIGCGPESMKIGLSNTVARAQRQVIRGHAAEVKLHTDTFGW
ncbi:hypothetical protein ASPWEDRAFT_25415 [Aspergillus wentii DTO 134E9]|uniref:ferric-chelate reductase (NADPH) n=1 Tax=Aspergillus wentii DTO 134E9 TaxID=1073089 RepID=A0A1L9RXD9_ASPWE|nr:uncharacterized protein ASPWEDRAFT_25415 [Aspergillus wentii DTO 134E9]KAI9931729.1 hypothetical protein MW887_010308 [Aspergillus wentii]OJJ39592.1 hypothetical protein ASPWEDRAFT_25415 [Aspergillus wentii DTO 134E9]